MNTLPPVTPPPTVGPLVFTATGNWSSGQLLSRAGSLAEALPEAIAALNFCERRQNFLVGFVALLMRGQVCLMPPSRAPAVVAEVLKEHPGAYVLDDSIVDRYRAGAGVEREFPHIPPDRVVIVGYTSGTTGRPRANPKSHGGVWSPRRISTPGGCERPWAWKAGRRPWCRGS